MTDRTRTIRPNDDSTVGKPSTSSDPFADYTAEQLQDALAWLRGDRTGERPAPILSFVDYRLIAQAHLTPEEAVAVATVRDLELRFEILDRAYARSVAR